MTRPGLTLIETLAATVILSASAAVCASMLRGARSSLDSPRQSIEALASLADAFMEDPESFGIQKSSLPETKSFSLQWPELLTPDLAAVKVSTAAFTDRFEGTQSHSWLVFEHEGLTVVRYLALPENKQ